MKLLGWVVIFAIGIALAAFGRLTDNEFVMGSMFGCIVCTYWYWEKL